jgi:hypothetical protein
MHAAHLRDKTVLESIPGAMRCLYFLLPIPDVTPTARHIRVSPHRYAQSIPVSAASPAASLVRRMQPDDTKLPIVDG